jgi:diketogulonate reductase-like aldo/keto reductase
LRRIVLSESGTSNCGDLSRWWCLNGLHPRLTQALGVAALDLFCIAWPVALRPGTEQVDDACTLEGTWAQMEALVDAGITRYVGVSNFDLPQVSHRTAQALPTASC